MARKKTRRSSSRPKRRYTQKRQYRGRSKRSPKRYSRSRSRPRRSYSRPRSRPRRSYSRPQSSYSPPREQTYYNPPQPVNTTDIITYKGIFIDMAGQRSFPLRRAPNPQALLTAYKTEVLTNPQVISLNFTPPDVFNFTIKYSTSEERNSVMKYVQETAINFPVEINGVETVLILNCQSSSQGSC